jgi:hypothetical protein
VRRGAAESRVHAARRRLTGPGGIGQVDNFQAAGAVEDDFCVDGVPGQRDGQASLPAGPGRLAISVSLSCPVSRSVWEPLAGAAGKLVPAAPDRLVDYPSLGVQLEHVDALRRVGLD